MEAKFSNRVKEVISLSREEALRLGHDYIGTEHLLLGVIREGEGVAIGLLKKGDNIIFAAFGGGFTWGSIYLKWAYNS